MNLTLPSSEFYPLLADSPIPEVEAVYLVWCDDVVKYIGSTGNLAGRFRSHNLAMVFRQRPDCTFTYIPCGDRRQRFQPELNQQGAQSFFATTRVPEITVKRYSPQVFAAMLGVSVSTLQRWDRTGVLTAGRTITGRRTYTDLHLQRALEYARPPKEQK